MIKPVTIHMADGAVFRFPEAYDAKVDDKGMLSVAQLFDMRDGPGSGVYQDPFVVFVAAPGSWLTFSVDRSKQNEIVASLYDKKDVGP